MATHDVNEQRNAKMKRKLKENQLANIKFFNLTYKVMESLKKTKTIVNGASGEFRAGELTAIMGPSGSGKSTLLNLLAGFRIQPDDGHIHVNDQPLKRNKFRKMSRYVLQQDLLNPYFTIEETLMFASNFKCPAHYTTEKRKMKINEILQEFHLLHQANTMIGKISGGELKRVSIALEILDNPSVLFLDEPTTGLDESSAMQCIVQLKHLAQSGRTIVCSIHSPSARLIDMFDKIYVLAEGQCIYQGKGDHIVTYLQNFQLNCPLTYNPADFIIEVATCEYGSYQNEMVARIQNGKIAKWLPDAEKCKSLEFDSECLDYGIEDKDVNLNASQSEDTRISWLVEFKCLLAYNMKQMTRDKTNFRLRIIVHVFISALIGWSYFGVGRSAKFALFNYHLCLLSAVMCGFISMTPMFALVAHEMHYLRRQHFNQWYRLGTWFMALLMAQLPIVITMTTICTGIIYALSGHPLEVLRFTLFVAIMILATLVGISYGVFMGSRLRLLNALFMGPNIYAVFVIFANLSIDATTDIPLIKSILMYGSFVRHTLEGLLSALFHFQRSDLECMEIFCYAAKPSVILKTVGFTNMHFLRAVFCLLAFYVGFLILAFMNFKMRLNPLGVVGRNRYYRYIKQNMANYFNFGVKL